MTVTSGTRLGPYEVVSPIGSGGMGEVYRARDTKLGRDAALKFLPPAFAEDAERLARFRREAQILASLSHPNIAAIYGLEEGNGLVALAMELVPGEDLSARLARGPLPVDEALAVARQIAEALEEAHGKGIVHRDLKPANVKFTAEGKVKVLDFGLAKAMDPPGAASPADAGGSPTMMNSPTVTDAGTRLGVILGTAAYMSPEQARGGTVDKRADVWAFGVVLFEMLSGRSLFAAETVSDTLAGVLKGEIDLSAVPSTTPAPVVQLLRRCLERNPKNRLHDVADARIVLDEIAGGVAEAPRPAAAPARRASRRELAAWGLAFLATVAAAALLVGRLRRPTGPAVETAGVTRFTVVPAEKGTIEGYPALSPDGRTLVYALQQEDGTTALWAHSFETGTSRRLPGTDEGDEPFWAPDGRQLAFFASGQLKRLDLATGLAQSLFRVADPRGGAWSREGDILVSINTASAILRISAASGESRPATRLAPDLGEQSHRYPWALPGGGFLYTSTGGIKVQGIYWQGPGASPAKRLLPDVSRAAYDERGFLLWVRDGVLVAQRFDAGNGTLSGGLIPVAEQIGADEGKGASSWFTTSNAGTIALRQGVEQRNELVWIDRKGALLGALARPGRYAEPAISLDGRHVAVATTDPARGSTLWIYDASGVDRARRLTFDAAGGETGIWSPDGRWVAYSSARSKGFTLFRKAADGSGDEETLFESGAGSWIDSWSADGRYLLFERIVPEQGSDLWVLPLATPRKAVPYLETPANEGHAAFSPDGSLVAYVSDEGGVPQIYVRTFPISGSRWQVSLSGGDWPAWSADGRELFYAGLDRTLEAVPITSLSPFSFGASTHLFRMRVPQPAITSARTYFAPAPDGRRFLVNQLVGTEGGNRLEVLLGWSPESRPR